MKVSKTDIDWMALIQNASILTFLSIDKLKTKTPTTEIKNILIDLVKIEKKLNTISNRITQQVDDSSFGTEFYEKCEVLYNRIVGG